MIWNTLQPAFFLGALGLVLAISLAIAHRIFYVLEDPRFSEVQGLLPQSNCGACGEPSCSAFAKKLIQGQANPAGCTQSSQGQIEIIAHFLQVEVGDLTRKIARIACQGGGNVAGQRATYQGFHSCSSANLVAGGAKGCAWGCLGLGDCEVACHYDALYLDPVGLPFVSPEKCIACGDCVTACPKDLFSLVEETKPLFVACKNLLEGEEAEEDCMVACTGCGLCESDAPQGMIHIAHHLAILDPSYKQTLEGNQNATERCPTGAIGIWQENGAFQKGRQAKKIIHQDILEVG